MPSPRWPMRVIASRSTTLRLEQKLAIAVAAEDRRGDDTADAPAARGHECFHVFTDRGVDERIAHDALLAIAARRLELRLDQRNERGARLQQLFDRRQHELQRDEAHVHGSKVR